MSRSKRPLRNWWSHDDVYSLDDTTRCSEKDIDDLHPGGRCKKNFMIGSWRGVPSPASLPCCGDAGLGQKRAGHWADPHGTGPG